MSPVHPDALRERRRAGAEAEKAFRAWATRAANPVSDSVSGSNTRKRLKASQIKTFSDRGWPDYLCEMEDGSVCCIEVKYADGCALSAAQIKVMRLLERAGIPCYRWSPDVGLSRWSSVAAPIPEKLRVKGEPEYRHTLASNVMREHRERKWERLPMWEFPEDVPSVMDD